MKRTTLFLIYCLLTTLGLRAAVSVTAPSLSITTASYPSAYAALGNIVIDEGALGDFSIPAVSTNYTIVINAPANFEFQAGVGSVAGGADITAVSVTVTATVITVTYQSSEANRTNEDDILTISGIMVRAINTASAGNAYCSVLSAAVAGLTAGAPGTTMATFTSITGCTHTCRITDTYGDGWNGGTVKVQVNGLDVLVNVGSTFVAGFGPVNFSFTCASGDIITVIETAAGSWPTEMRVEILDGLGASLGPPFDPNAVGTNFNGLCPGPMSYASSTVTQSSVATIPNCGIDEQIVCLQVTMTGATSPLVMTQIRPSFAGTSPVSAVAIAKIYYTGTSAVFAASTLFGSAVPSVAPYNINGSQTLVNGVNYFWLVYDLNNTGIVGNTVDGLINQFTISATNYVPAVTSPAGTRTIAACPSYPGAASPNIKVWLKANSGVTTAGPSVTQWNDNSGAGVTGNFIVQPGAPAQSSPTLVANAVNYNPYVSFNGGTNSMASNNTFNGGSMFDANNNTIFMVHNLKAGIVYFKWETSGVGNYRVGYERNANSVRFDFVNDGAGQNNVSTTNVINRDVLVTTTTDAVNSEIRLNGNTDAVRNISGAGSFSPGVNARRLAIGNNDLTTNNLPAQIDYAEIISYNTKLAPIQIRMVESYLAIKYGITLGNNQGAGSSITYKNSSGISTWDNQTGYHNNVIGIGRDDASTLDQRISRGVVSLNASLDLITLVNGTFAAPAAFTSNLSTLIIGHNAGTPQSVWGDPSFSNYPAALGANAARIQRVWKAQATNFTQSVSIGFESTMLIAWTPVSNLRLLVDNDGNFANGGTTIYTGAVLNGSRIEFTGITNLGTTGNLYFSLATVNYSATPLPVTLTAFSGACNSGIITLEWTTQSETNNDFFTLERSDDGILFYEIAVIQGSGTTSQISNYSFTDPESVNAPVYYRLSQTDENGATEVLRLIVIESCELNSTALLYPNPASGSCYFIFPAREGETAELILFDALGRQVASIVEQKTFEEGVHQVEIDLSGIAPGVYYLRLTVEGRNSVHKLIRE